MKVYTITVVFISILLLFGCSNKTTEYQLSESDKEAIAKVANEYYENLDNQNYSLIFNAFAASSNYIDLETRLIAIKELTRSISYKIEWYEEISTGSVSYNTKENMPFLYTIITVNYDHTTGSDMNEVLYFVKENDQWKIKIIDTLDRYIPYRAPDYRISRTIDDLKPNYD